MMTTPLTCLFLAFAHVIKHVVLCASVQAISVILFQVLGAAMALQEYQKTGVLSR